MANTTSSGIIAGANPLTYDPSAPYTIFIFQMILIILTAELLHYPLSKIQQPRVISEVLAGIVLGPTAFGKIPNFTNTVFPTAASPGLSLVSTLGICLLLFMVGCEVDIKFMRKHLVTAMTVGIFNMALPFGLGCAYSVSLWKEYRVNVPDLPTIKFTTFMVFIGVSMCITAFPVLVRILTELRLVKDRVGVVVLAAGITNDLLGWIFLALSITLANSGKSQIAGYIVLVTIGWGLFICYPVRWFLRWLLTSVLHDLDNPNGPSTFAMMCFLLMTFASAFFTDIIGVHPIFGAFMMGTIVPRDNNYVIRLTERIEDLVNIIFSPLYFGIAGLNADLTLLNKGIDWAYIVGLIAIALFGKIVGGMLAARLHGLFWRESLSVGVLMSCKGIVEIVVLQTGLKAGIISRKVFSMFILMALVTTFLTTPLTLLCYPQSYRDSVKKIIREKEFKEIEKKRLAKNGEGYEGTMEAVSSSTRSNSQSQSPVRGSEVISGPKKSTKSLVKKYKKIRFDKLILPVDSLESVSNNLILIDRFCKPGRIPMHAVNLKQLTDRTADLLHASMMREMDDQFDQFDGQYLNGILSILKIFCELSGVPFSSEIVFSLPENVLQSLLLNQNLLPHDLLILTIGSKYYRDHVNFNDQFTKVVADADLYSAVFINNNQDIGKLNDANEDAKTANKSYIEEESLLSSETILNPKSFEITTVTLISNPGEATKEELIALKLFSILVKDEDVSAGFIVSSKDVTADLYSVLAMDTPSDGKVQSIVYGDDEEHGSPVRGSESKTYQEFVLSQASSIGAGKIDELVIITESCPFSKKLMENLVANNKKILMVF
ncbi:DEKNAAC102947 [Brettanomyces naardenensis]|uniref:DEKNAAC102947 n=1 Tax=Brettanomyces naardenensis TaxID=13370 RepID=A0A448YM22_BRENA|nr:DEKNAAC102947 [Brettanomyces naardenensis]